MYILSDNCKSEPEAGLVAPALAAPRGKGGCRASAGRSGKPKLGLLKGTYRKTMRQIRCCLYKGINTKELDASLCFGAQSKSWGQGPPAVPWHRDTNTAQFPQRRGQGQGPGACLSRLGMGNPLTVHGAPQQLLHVPRHIHRVFQVKITLGVQHRVGVLGVHVVMRLGADCR